ncbi:MAG: CopG family transcriptional regulator [Demequina sp.]|jgi:predicted transcriptional regulator|nr:CopG family transcriptional regulator [Demequina sp.]
MPRAKKGERITVSLSGRDHASLAELADRYDVSLSWLVRQAVTEFLERSESGEVQLPLQLGPGKGVRKE